MAGSTPIPFISIISLSTSPSLTWLLCMLVVASGQRTHITVAQDGSGDYKTITVSLQSLSADASVDESSIDAARDQYSYGSNWTVIACITGFVPSSRCPSAGCHLQCQTCVSPRRRDHSIHQARVLQRDSGDPSLHGTTRLWHVFLI